VADAVGEWLAAAGRVHLLPCHAPVAVTILRIKP